MKYHIVKKCDNSIVSGIFFPITTLAMAMRIKKQWEYNYPKNKFAIQIIKENNTELTNCKT
jgi:hypothetical protein